MTADSIPTVRVDFQNADAQGRVRLNTAGTFDDLHALELHDGVRLRLTDDELHAEGVVEYSSEEQVWVARVDWDAVLRSADP